MSDGICSVDGCTKPAELRGWCKTHYSRWWNKGDPLAPTRHRSAKRPEGCSVEGCNAPGFRREWCIAHYTRWQRTGDPLGSRVGRRPIDDFHELRLLETDECVLWPHGLDSQGYGRVHANGGSRKVQNGRLSSARHDRTG